MHKTQHGTQDQFLRGGFAPTENNLHAYDLIYHIYRYDCLVEQRTEYIPHQKLYKLLLTVVNIIWMKRSFWKVHDISTLEPLLILEKVYLQNEDQGHMFFAI